jgi:ribosomal-protein-alanine N-acetyltransferase
MDVDKLFSHPPVFETERLLLRKLGIADAKEYFLFASDPAVSTDTLWDRHDTIEDTIRYLKKVMLKYELKQAFRWGIIDKLNMKLIGRTGLISIDPVHERAEIGFAISSGYWNKGVVSEATSEIVKYCFIELGLNRVEGRCNFNNTGSIRVMEKLGMKFEGTLRQQLKIKGKFIDQRMYSILKGEFVSDFEEGSSIG